MQCFKYDKVILQEGIPYATEEYINAGELSSLSQLFTTAFGNILNYAHIDTTDYLPTMQTKILDIEKKLSSNANVSPNQRKSYLKHPDVKLLLLLALSPDAGIYYITRKYSQNQPSLPGIKEMEEANLYSLNPFPFPLEKAYIIEDTNKIFETIRPIEGVGIANIIELIESD